MSMKENVLSQVYVLENHPADSRVKISKDNIFQTLSSRMGTGGGQYADDNGGRNGTDCKKINAFGVRTSSGLS